MSDQNNGYGAKNVQVIPVTTFLTQYTDGNGEEEVRMGFVIGTEVRFLEQKSLSKPAQSWLRDDILKALGKAPGEKAPEASVPAPLPVPSGVETQV